MEKKVALIGIIVTDRTKIPKLNEILSANAEYIIGRMGIPHVEEEISLISIAIDAPADVISALSGKIGMLSGISSKVIYAKK